MAASPPQLARACGEVTLREVAAAAQVHPATASRALHPGTRDMVSPATAGRVERAARDLGYLPNQVAVSLRTRRTCSAGVLVADLGDPLAAALARGAEEHLAGAGYLPVIRSADAGRGRALAVVTQMRAHHVDGLIVAVGPGGALLAGGASAGRSRLPVVWAGSVPPASGLPAVSADRALGMRMVMDHLATTGHRVIGCVTGPGTGVSKQELAAAAAAAGLAAPARLTRSGRSASPAEGLRCARNILAAGTGCTAIVAGSDLLAAGCCQAIAEAGLGCPRDISVTGFGDIPLAYSLQPPLTTVRLPQYRIGTAAAQLLLELLTGPSSPAFTVLIRPRLIVRTSSGPAPSARVRGVRQPAAALRHR